MGRKKSGQLFALQLPKLGKGNHGDGGGLYLIKSEEGTSGKWAFRFISPITKKRRWMGLGAFPDVGLSEARDKALIARKLLTDRQDPIEERRKEERERLKEAGNSFETIALLYIEKNKDHWRGGHTQRHAENTLKNYAFPLFGNRPAASITRDDFVAALSPPYEEKKADTVRKLYRYIRKVLELSKAEGARIENIPQWKGDLEITFPNLSDLKPVKHHEALKSKDVALTMQRLKRSGGMAALACRFIMLTGCRSKEGRGAKWEEIDLKENLWTIPGSRMKEGKPHSVPLSRPILDLLDEIKPLNDGKPCALLFPSSKRKELSDAGILKAFKAARPANSKATVHGLRSTFLDWLADETDYPEELGKYALAHATGDKVHRAYRRNTAIEKRRPLMEDWGKLCMGEMK